MKAATVQCAYSQIAGIINPQDKDIYSLDRYFENLISSLGGKLPIDCSLIKFIQWDKLQTLWRDCAWTGVRFPSPPPNLMPNLDVITKNVDLINVIYNFIPNFKKSIYHGCHPNYVDVMHDIWTIFIKSSPYLDVINF